MRKSKNPSPTIQGKEGKPAMIQLQIRAPVEFLDRIDKYVAQLNYGKTIPVATRSWVIKQCLQTGLDQLERTTPSGDK